MESRVQRLVGADMLLDEASVTGTANIIGSCFIKEKQLFIMLPVSLCSSSCVKCAELHGC
jgi:hypothetical protein